MSSNTTSASPSPPVCPNIAARGGSGRGDMWRTDGDKKLEGTRLRQKPAVRGSDSGGGHLNNIVLEMEIVG
ncbi:hypothetical protein VZT92_004841 [Zoarces viviparus]|uniref:Uncharacterized protein n=1 Tax=Zoarces viviparus TaxID=48416 RepID=A0AAW1FRA2_ZOAVI